MQYYGTRLSENISRRDPEGYLLCLNVPVARTGIQEYLPEELGLSHSSLSGAEGTPGIDRRGHHQIICSRAEGTPGIDRRGHHQILCSRAEGGPGGDRKAPRINSPCLIPVQRPASEVFAPETIASFEGMPVTDDHPPDGVTVENIRALQKGHTHNVRRGTGEESDLLLADLIITDPVLIDRILAGKREISCGYTYELCLENGQYIQRKIRGNHVAVVDAGRAGARVSIKDEHPQPKTKPERSPVPMKKSLLKKLSLMARDGDPEAIEALAEAVEEMAEAVAPEPETTPALPEATLPEAENDPAATDSDTLTAILERLDQLIALLTPAATDEDPGDPAAPPLSEELAEVVEEALEAANESLSVSSSSAEDDPDLTAVIEEVLSEESSPESIEVSAILAPEEEPGTDCGDPRRSADALRAALTAVRPALKAMAPRTRRKVCADIASRLSRQRAADSRRYATLLSSRKPAVRNGADLGKRIMAKRNPNYHA